MAMWHIIDNFWNVLSLYVVFSGVIFMKKPMASCHPNIIKQQHMEHHASMSCLHYNASPPNRTLKRLHRCAAQLHSSAVDLYRNDDHINGDLISDMAEKLTTFIEMVKLKNES